MIHHGDCLEVMAGMEPESVDAVVTDPPYGLEFMGKEWDSFRVDDPGTARNRGDNAGDHGKRTGGTFASDGRPKAKVSYGGGERPTTSRCVGCGKRDQRRNPHSCPDGTPWKTELIDPYAAPPTSLAYGEWCRRWALEAYRVAKPSAYLLAFGGTRTVHRLTSAIEDAGWIIRDMLVWAYASGFPKSKASLKPAWEPIVMARKPGPLRMLAIDECRIGTEPDDDARRVRIGGFRDSPVYGSGTPDRFGTTSGRWPANVILTDPIFDGGWEGVVGGGESAVKGEYRDIASTTERPSPFFGSVSGATHDYRNDNTYANDSGTYSRFFLIPKADRADREPVLGGLPERDAVTTSRMVDFSDPRMDRPQLRRTRANVHPTVKPVDLMRHLVRLVTPTGGTVLDPFLGSGTTAIAAEMEGFDWIGIEKEAEYVAIAEARLNGTQRGLGLPA